MPWYGWYSARQEKLFGYAHYQNKKGNLVCITKVSQDQNFKHHYKDSVYQGELTHFIEVQKWNYTNKRAQEAKDNIIPANGPPCLSRSDWEKNNNRIKLLLCKANIYSGNKNCRKT